MKHASHFDIFLVSATLVVIAVVAGVLVYQKSDTLQERHNTVFEPKVRASADITPDIKSKADEEVSPTLPVENISAEDYRTKVKFLVSAYNNETLNYFAAETAYQYNINQLLAMEIPEGYQSFHVSLLEKFEDLHQAMTDVIDKQPLALSNLEVARENMDVFLADNSWLRQ